MKKHFYLIIFCFLFSKIIVGQEINEYYFKFTIESKSEIEKLTQLISIDNVKGNEVFAYANQIEFNEFEKLGYTIEFLEKDIPKTILMANSVNEMANWNRYPTYEVYQKMMKNFEANYPSICKLDSIGTTVNGRKLYVVKISDNVAIDETEPEFFYTSTIHGDEATGYILMLRLIDSLLTNYGVNPEIDHLVNSIEIYINPNANPDGTYRGGNQTVASATRYNANNKDLNRDFPDPRIGLNAPYQPETQAMMNFASSRHFVMALNFHGGAEVMNYPWDTWTTSQNPNADANWYKRICTNYVSSARKINPNYMKDVTSSGVTEGGDWYVITGGRQDYMNYWNHCREVTIEISSTKLLAIENLNYYWRINRQSLLDYLKECTYGFHGTVKNSLGNPIKGKISIENHDQLNDSSIVYSDYTIGDFHRPIDTGKYTVVCSVNGYSPLKVKNIPINLYSTIQLDFVFDYFSLIAIPSSVSDILSNQNNVVEHFIVLHNPGIEANNYTVTIENPTENTWLSVNKNNGIIQLESSDTLKLTLIKGTLQPGEYSTNLIIGETDGDSYIIPVSIFIPDTSLVISPMIIKDTLDAFETSTHKISIYNSGSYGNNYSVAIADSAINSWIGCNKLSGTINSLISDSILISLTNNFIASGDYYTVITITESDSDIYTIPVYLNIPVYPDTSIAITPAAIYDTLRTSENSIKEIIIYNSGTVQNIYTVSFESNDQPTWISLSKQKDTIQSQQSDTIFVYLSNNSLSAGDYSCNINIIEEDNDIYNVNTNLNVPVIDQIIENENKNIIQIFPNPFSDHLVVELKNDDPEKIIIQLIDIRGNLVLQKLFLDSDTGNRYINLGSLQNLINGTYILKVIINNDIYSIPVIKN